MGSIQRERKRIRRIMANPVGWWGRADKSLDRYERKVKSDAHMQHHWLSELKRKTLASDRKPAPFHNGRKR